MALHPMVSWAVSPLAVCPARLCGVGIYTTRWLNGALDPRVGGMLVVLSLPLCTNLAGITACSFGACEEGAADRDF